MKSNIVAIALILGLVSIEQVSSTIQHPVREEIVEQIKLKTTKWKPMEMHENSFRDHSAESLHKRLGALDSAYRDTTPDFLQQALDVLKGFTRPVLDLFNRQPLGQADPIDLPKHFDAREEWPDCIGPVRNQGECGACWAFAAAGLLQDRFCIQSKGDVKVTLSPQDMVSCDFENYGCQGGYLLNSVDFLQSEGLVTEECLPYKDEDRYCYFKCQNTSMKYEKYYCSPNNLEVAVQNEEIQANLMTNGPMMVGLVVFEDFYSYQSGIYHYTTGQQVGGHAMKLIGWGHDQDDGSLFWILQNQWGEKWGMSGFVYIKAGEIGIDSMALACVPDLVNA